MPATADLMLAITTKQDKDDLIQFKQLKNRYSDITRNTKFVVNVLRSKMKLIDIPKGQQPKLADDGTNKYYTKTSEADTKANPYVFTTKPRFRKNKTEDYDDKVKDFSY